jgi:hypothetical protein
MNGLGTSPLYYSPFQHTFFSICLLRPDARSVLLYTGEGRKMGVSGHGFGLVMLYSAWVLFIYTFGKAIFCMDFIYLYFISDTYTYVHRKFRNYIYTRKNK